MRAGIVVNVTRADRLRLEAIVADRSAPQKHVWRAKVILATADGCGTAEIMRRSGKSKPVVWTWQARFMVEGGQKSRTRKAFVVLVFWVAGLLKIEIGAILPVMKCSQQRTSKVAQEENPRLRLIDKQNMAADTCSHIRT